MGAWGFGSFENDSALDWVSHLTQYDDLSFIISTLGSAIDDPLVTFHHSYVNSKTLHTAIAAAETVAVLIGQPSVDIPEELNEWIQKLHPHVGEDTIELAQRVVAHVLQTQVLRDLWEEDYESWRSEIENLQLRLQT